VQEVAAIGVRPAGGRAEIRVHIVPCPGQEATEEEIIAFCRSRLRTYQVPHKVTFRDEMPRSYVGKVLRQKLVEEELTSVEI
jgi:long-chain acyl-CoA synthetase